MRIGMMLLAAGLLLTGTVMAQPDPPAAPPSPGHEKMKEAHEKMRQVHVTVNDGKLNLTEAQQKEMANLRIELQKKNIPLQSKIRMARLEIEQIMLGEKPEKGKVAKQMKEIADLELQVKLNQLDHRFAVRGLLTPDQLKEWKDGPGRGMGMGVGPMFRKRIGARAGAPGAGMSMMKEGFPIQIREGFPIEVQEGFPLQKRMRWIQKEDGDEENVMILRGEAAEDCEEECAEECSETEGAKEIVIEKKIQEGEGPAKVIIEKRSAKAGGPTKIIIEKKAEAEAGKK